MLRVYSLTKTPIFQSLNLFTSMQNRLSFSTEKPAETPTEQIDDLEDFKLVRGTLTYFYRRSLRRLVEKNRTFNYHHLLRVVKITRSKKDALMAFEAYYNYLGRNVIMSQTAVDRLILRTSQIVNNEPSQKQIEAGLNIEEINAKITKKILEVFSHQDYLSYFPHYDATVATIKLSTSNEQYLDEILTILGQQLLVKMNPLCFKLLAENIKLVSWTLASKTAKLVALRMNFLETNEQWSVKELGNIFVQTMTNLTQNPQARFIKHSDSYKKWLQLNHERLNNSELTQQQKNQLYIANSIGLLSVKKVDQAFSILENVKQLNQGSKPFFEYLNKLISFQNSPLNLNQIEEKLRTLKQGKNVSTSIAEYFTKLDTSHSKQ